MFALAAMLLLGFLLAGVFQFLMTKTTLFGRNPALMLLITYPLTFIPAMVYASAHSFEQFGTEVPRRVDDGHFAPVGGLQAAVTVSIATICLAIVTEPLVAMLPPMPENLKNALELMTDGPLWISLISVSVFAPFFEEWLCRGMILRGLLTKTRPAVAITVSAAFFAIIHFNPWQAIPAFLLGCLFGLVYYKTGSLKLTMLMHCVNNTFSVLIGRLPQFRDIEYTWEAMGNAWAYGMLYTVCIAMIVLFTTKITTTKFTDSNEQ